ncbi:MAG: FMN-binding protein [Beduini sp.]|uniref:FMN-binding protein n=1 Tax=Beduini sp. TaxID=1922300 RepID=UPI0011C8FF05
MKKLLLILPLVLLCGCKSVKEGADDMADTMNKYNDGIYTTTVQGYGGPFEISMTYKDDKIMDVTVGENNETPSIGGVAAEQISKNVVEQNTVELDTISGATVTSTAMYDGLKVIERRANKETADEGGNLNNGQSSNSEGQPTQQD